MERVRQRLKSDVPILFVTARTDEQDVVAALREGADDYIAKPLKRLELIARLDAVMRRAAAAQPASAPAIVRFPLFFAFQAVALMPPDWLGSDR